MPPFTHPSLAYCHSPPLPHRHPQRPEGRSPLSSAPTAHKCLPGCFANCWTEPESPNDEVCTQEWETGWVSLQTDLLLHIPAKSCLGEQVTRRKRYSGSPAGNAQEGLLSRQPVGQASGSSQEISRQQLLHPNTNRDLGFLPTGTQTGMLRTRISSSTKRGTDAAGRCIFPPSAAPTPVTALLARQHLQGGDRSSPPPRSKQW